MKIPTKYIAMATGLSESTVYKIRAGGENSPIKDSTTDAVFRAEGLLRALITIDIMAVRVGGGKDDVPKGPEEWDKAFEVAGFEFEKTDQTDTARVYQLNDQEKGTYRAFCLPANGYIFLERLPSGRGEEYKPRQTLFSGNVTTCGELYTVIKLTLL